MTSVAYVEKQLELIMEERANELAKETGAVKRERKLSGADLLQTLVFGWQQHPQASLERLASTAEVRDVSLTDTAMHNRFTPDCVVFLHRVLEEMSQVVVEAAQDVPVELLRRFSAVILEDSSTISLPSELVQEWQGCGGSQGQTAAALKLHTRWELKRGRLWGPSLSNGRTSDHKSPFNEEPVLPGSLSIQDLGYFSVQVIAQRRRGRAYSLTRLLGGTALFSCAGKRLLLQDMVPPRVGQMKQMHVLVGARERVPMRVLMLRVPKEVGDERRENLLAEAKRRGQSISEETLHLADWTILITDVPAKRLSFEEALVLQRERWQMELLYKLWKQSAQVDEWRTSNPWRVLCELYAKLIGALIQHWLIVLFAWQDPQRSLVKLAQVVRDTSWCIMQALAGGRSMRKTLRLIERRMRSGSHMNTRHKHPNSPQLLERGTVEWPLTS